MSCSAAVGKILKRIQNLRTKEYVSMNKQSKKVMFSCILIAILALVFSSLACGSSAPVVNPPQDNQNSQSGVSTPNSQSGNTPKPIGSARSNPAPFGYEVTIDNMTFKVTEVVRPADTIIKQGNSFNSDAGEGKEYVLVQLNITCNKNSDEKCNVIGLEFSLVGSSGQTYDPEILISGVNGMLETGDFYGGATKSGYLAFIVSKDETNNVLIYESLLGSPIYLSVEK
jgi:hypothetical protein